MAGLNDEAMAWVVRELEGELTPDERAALKAWYETSPRHMGAYARAHAIHHSVNQVAIQENLRLMPVPDNLRPPGLPQDEDAPGPETATAAPPGRQRRVFAAGALAAGLAVMVGGVLLPKLSGGAVFQTARGEFRKVQLEDQSILSINGDSEVSVELAQDQRRVSLERGEAWFEVAKDRTKPFVVAAGDARVRAIGTAFSVRRRENGADVLVTEGTVEVWSDAGGAAMVRLGAGMQAFVPRRASSIAVVSSLADIERKLAWREGKLIFQGDPLAAAVSEFNRYNARQLSIADPSLRQLPLIGRYRTTQPELFAEDVRMLFKVPVLVTRDKIQIGLPQGRRLPPGS